MLLAYYIYCLIGDILPLSIFFNIFFLWIDHYLEKVDSMLLICNKLMILFLLF